MSKKFFVVWLFCTFVAAVFAQLSWPEPLTIAEYENYGFDGKVITTPDSRRILLYSKYENETNHCYMQAYNQDNQALWTSPVALDGALDANHLFLTDQNHIACFNISPGNPYYNLYVTKYNLNGVQIGTPNVMIMYRYVGNLKLFSDHQGGIHVFGKDGNRTGYQHIYADGSIEHPYSGVNFPLIDWEAAIYNISIRNDGKIMISYADSPNTGLFVMDSSLNVQFSFTFPMSSGDSYYGWCALRSDDGFYMTINSDGLYKLYSYNSSGQSLWNQPVLLPAQMACDKMICDSQDRLIMTTDRSYQYYVQLYDTSGNGLYGVDGVHLFDFNSGDFAAKIMLDGVQGFYLMKQSGTNYEPSDLRYVNTADGSSSWVLPLSNLTGYQGRNTHHAWVDGGMFNLYNYQRMGEISGIYFNRANSSGNLEFASPGQELMSGSCGVIAYPVIGALGTNRAIAIWAVMTQDNPVRRILKYNLIEPGTGWVYEEDRYLLTVPQDIRDLKCFATDEGNALIVWGVGGYGFYAQEVNHYGSQVWPTAKLLVNTTTNNKLYASYHDGSLYLAYTASGPTIRMQRYIDGEPVWETQGVVVASNSLGYPNLTPTLEYLTDRTVVWSVWDNDTHPLMAYYNIVDENGQSLPGFTSSGLFLNAVQEPYHGFRVNGVRRGGDRLWLELSMARSVWIQEGHSGGYWSVAFDPVIQAVSDDGQILLPIGGLSTMFSYGSIADETAYYKCWQQPTNKLKIAKYNLSGNLQWVQSPFSEVNWSFSSGISLQKVSENEFLVYGATFSGSTNQYSYFSFSPDGQITAPPDMIFGQNGYGIQAELTNTRMGTYFLMYNTSGITAKVQYRASGAELGNSDEDSPAYSLISAYPNPFGDDIKLEFSMERPGLARLEIFNIRGQRILYTEYPDLLAGKNQIIWDGRDALKRECANGIYFIRMSNGKNTDLIKILRLR